MLRLATEVLAYACEVDPTLELLDRAVSLGFIDNNRLELCPLLAPPGTDARLAKAHDVVAARAAEVTAALHGR